MLFSKRTAYGERTKTSRIGMNVISPVKKHQLNMPICSN